MSTLGLLQSKCFMLTLLETQSIHDSMNRSKIEFIACRRDIVFGSSVHTFCQSGTISQYLLVRFDSFLVQMISTIDS